MVSRLVAEDLTETATSWRARALVDTAALSSNIALLRKIAPDSRLMAVIKADAYGHSLELVCRAVCDQVDAFAVATLSEGIQCRKIQRDIPVVVLSELWLSAQLELFEHYHLEPVIHNELQLEWLLRYSGTPLSVWIKIDSGMNRLGIAPDAIARYVEKLSALDCVGEIRLMSHLANADVPGDNYTTDQASRFSDATRGLGLERSLANSAGLLKWPDTRLDWNRPGLALYGIPPCELAGEPGKEAELKPVMQLQARLISSKTVDAGQPVGYGGHFHTRRRTRIGLVGFGYGDGYPRVVDERACVLVSGVRVPIIGRISMDMITVDLTDIENCSIGDVVTLWGEGIGVQEVADWAGTIPWELLCKVTPRIPRVMIEGNTNG